MRIADLKRAVIGDNPVVRIVTDEGVSGHAAVESYKPYLKPLLLVYRPPILGQDPRHVERVMLNIRHCGAFKPWGSAVSAIEMALWDIAGKVAGLPVHRLLGGKVRERVRLYNGAVRFPLAGASPHDYADTMARMAALVQVCATLPRNVIAFEYPIGQPSWWYDIVEGLPEPIVTDGFVDVDAWTRPGIGLDFHVPAARAHLRDEDADFFD